MYKLQMNNLETNKSETYKSENRNKLLQVGFSLLIIFSFLTITTVSYAATESEMNGTVDTTVVPVPAAAWLFASGLIGLLGFSRRSRREA